MPALCYFSTPTSSSLFPPRPLHKSIHTRLAIFNRLPSPDEKVRGRERMEAGYNRATELKQFDDSKAGVKGLLDAGITSIPRFFIHPPETLADLKSSWQSETDVPVIPTIDISGVDDPDLRPAIIDQIRRASSTFGFFQVTNHGVPLQILDRMREFHDQPAEIKARVYRREVVTGVSYISNIDLFHSKAASWRDTLQIRLGPTPPEHGEIPEICRDEVVEWDREIVRLGEVLMGVLCEGLGMGAERLRELTCGEGRVMVGHYYPYCPQPDLTVGITSHTDPGILTLLLQDHVGGLQVKYGGGWVDVVPVPDAIVINIGDLLQIVSNEEYKSVEHRVLANGGKEARVSVAVFLNPSVRDNFYGPLPELISPPEKPQVYRQFTYEDYIRRFFTKELDGKSLPNFYRV